MISAATFFAGLLLTYIGSSLAAYRTYDAVQQESVRTSFLARAYIAFLAFTVSVAGGVFAFFAAWNHDPSLLGYAGGLLAFSTVAGIICAFLTVWEIG